MKWAAYYEGQRGATVAPPEKTEKKVSKQMDIDHASITAVLAYHAGVSHAKQVSDMFPQAGMFPEASGEYREMWAGRLAKGFAHAWGKMDFDTRRVYCGLAEEFAHQQAGALAASVEG